jgi:sugar lactone lactonase YvrE
MDVQCQNGELYVCENSRHRVVRYDRDGKQIAQFGKRDREGEGENFGSCCNPMNLCFNKDGNLYVSESNGAVKHFTPKGEFLGIVGVANVQPGCKNSCVGVTANDDRLFYIDIEKSQIIILARTEPSETN